MKHILRLPDGREISSGADAENAICSVELTRSVNDDTPLSLGTVFAQVMKLTIMGDTLSLPADSEVTLLQEEGDTRTQVGVFITEKPERTDAHTLTVTAYDRVILLDRDVTAYIESLTRWPYTLNDLAKGVCDYCGVPLAETDLPNGAYPVEKFSAEGVTGRQILQWIGQAAGRFCSADAEGILEFGWYRENTRCRICPTDPYRGALRVAGDTLELLLPEDTTRYEAETLLTDGRLYLSLSEDGTGELTVEDPVQHLFYYQNGLRFADYETAAIDRVQIRAADSDVGTVYPPDAPEGNTYVIQGNPLLTAQTGDSLAEVAANLHDILHPVRYTPCSVTLPADSAVSAGDILTVSDGSRQITVYVMTRKENGGRMTLECTGDPTPAVSAAANRNSYKALSGKILELRTDVDGIRAENRDRDGHVSALEMTVSGISASVSRQETDSDGIKTRLTAVEQNGDALKLQVESIRENGTDKVCTRMGYTFDDEGLKISRSGEQMENRLDNTGMYVSRGDTEILRANADGVLATDVTIRNYLCIGTSSRFEDYGTSTQKRTACFFVG